MTTQQRLHIIKQFPLFAGLEEEELRTLAEHAKEKTFPPHTIILSPNQISEGVYLLYKGLLKIYLITSRGKLIPIRIRGPLYIASERNMIGEDRKVTMETIQETQVLMLNKVDCRNIVMKHSEIMFMLLQIVIGKLQVIHEQIENYYSLSLKERTINMLMELAPHFSEKIITLSHEELADLIGATRARVTEALQELRNENKISLKYREIKIL